MRIPEPQSPAQMTALSEDETLLLLAQRNEALARAADDFARLADALITLGELDRAIALGSELAGQIQAALDAPDDEHCDCRHSIEVMKTTAEGAVIVDRATGEPQWHPEPVQAPNYVKLRRLWSARHQSMVWLHACALCGHLNAHPNEMDALHARVAAARVEYAKINQGPDSAVLPKA